ncbi:DnaA regulatory inactivator Hda [Candidatus Colwellia aromaticivorans]|uniref:DnaA regulatory inactivator Hda n=1 Tax=Candidatus Colwellia aromaticivorans TaxID=2267621 RepID=UPI000DF1BC02|nr:DnaA regulatory inactivator Hda [Candidatus Colwellia aromaticivorans]
MKNTSQLTLSVQLPDDETFSSYLSESNHLVVSQLTLFIEQSQVPKPNQPNSFYLFGLTGVGKSHLLHACSAYAAKLNKTSVCLSCAELLLLSVEVLDGLEQIDVICLDDIQLISGNKVWQQAIFDLYNRVIEHNNCLLISGDQSATQLGLSLPDLVSRLSWGLTEQVKPLDDDEKVTALQYRASKRGLTLSREAASFLLNRLSREMGNLIASLDILDKASIREQRKITIPFIKDVLNLSS